MNRALAAYGGLVARHAVAALAVLALVTVGLGAAASQVTMATSVESFAPDTELAQAQQRVRQEFGGDAPIGQVVVEATDGDVLDPAGVEAAGRIADAARQLTPEPRAVVSFATPLGEVGDETAIDEAAGRLTGDGSGGQAQLASLLADDLDPAAGTASAGLVVVTFGPDLEGEAAVQTLRSLRSTVVGLDLDGVTTTVFSPLLVQAASQDASGRIGLLFTASLGVIVVVLSLLFRRVSDVVLAVIGLAMAVTWMYGIGTLLGPDFLGVTGPFTQVATVVPVLVVGLGVDYAIHLTTRYREERAEQHGDGRGPVPVALATVGGALALTTMTTTVGFLSNVASPLGPVADFGVFTAAGVLAAFVVMLTLVPAARTVLDRRRPTEGASRSQPAVARLAGKGAAGLALGHPGLVVALTVVLTAGASLAATQVSTTFSQEQFVPRGSEVRAALQTVDRLFGGDRATTTAVVLDGDLATVEALGAVRAAEQQLLDTPRVQPSPRASVGSPASLVDAAAGAPGEPAETAFRDLGWRPDGVQPDADVPGLLDLAEQALPEAAASVLGPERRSGVILTSTTAGREAAPAVRDAMQPALQPVRDAGLDAIVTSELLVSAQTLEKLRRSQLVSIALTVAAVAILLVGYYAVTRRRPMLGLLSLVPTALVLTWVVAGMWVVGISFNVLSVTIASIGVAVGVDFGIHVTQRFTEERSSGDDLGEATRRTLARTGAALVGSATTTAGGFAVLILSDLGPIRQFGIIIAMAVVASVLAAVIVQPAMLVLWARWHDRRTAGAAA